MKRTHYITLFLLLTVFWLYVNSVIDEIYDKDIKSNNKIRKKNLFQKIQTYIINNFGSTTSINSICDYLRKMEMLFLKSRFIIIFIF